MCECGCAGMGPKFKFRGPRGVTYVLQIYPGCKGCSGPIGVDLHRYRGEIAKECAAHLPALDFHGDDEFATASVAVLDVEALRAALSEFTLREWKDGVKDKIGADIFADDAVEECVPKALDAAEMKSKDLARRIEGDG